MRAEIEEVRRVARRIAMRWCASASDAEDIAQDAAMRYLRQEIAPRNAAAWLFVVTRRLAYAQMLRGRARSEAELTFSRAQPATRTSAADILIDAAFVLEHLGGRDRRLLLLSIEGVPASDIARELGCHVHDIGQMVARARRKARRLMQ